MTSINAIIICLRRQVFSGIIQIIQCLITSPRRHHMQKMVHDVKIFHSFLMIQMWNLIIVPPFTKCDDKAISLNKDGPFEGLSWYAILHRKGLVQWVELFWQFHFQDSNQRIKKTCFKCDMFTSLWILLLLYIRLTMKNLIGREHSINWQ